MREASLSDITRFMQCKRVAVVGVSRKAPHFSRVLFREFLAKGYDAVPVNPQAPEIEGRKCFARVADIAPPVEAALLMTGEPAATEAAVEECSQAGIRNIWIYKSLAPGKHHAESVEASRLRGAAVVEGYCPFMFLPQAGMIHQVHRLFLKLAGNHPL